MENKEFKKALLESGTFTRFRKSNRSMFLEGKDFMERTKDLEKKYGKETTKACNQMLKSRQQQKKKVMEQFEYWLNRKANVYFVTLTYDSKKFNRKNLEKDLRERCTEVLRYFDDYSINIDYGKRKGRLHFHAIAYNEPGRENEEQKVKEEEKELKGNVDFNSLDLEFYREEVGGVYIEKAGTNEEDTVKLARYIAKLTNHSLKVKQSYVGTKKGSDYQEAKKWKNWLKRMKKERYFNIEKEVPGIVHIANGTDFENEAEYRFYRDLVLEELHKKRVFKELVKS